MSRFYGYVCDEQGGRGEATRCGHKGITTAAQSYAGPVIIDADEWTSYDGSIVRVPKPNRGEPQWSRHSTGAQWFHED